jgi:hypothetical protein
MKYIIHDPHECQWSISQSKTHDQPLKNAFFKFEDCFPYINCFVSEPGGSMTSYQSY